jgi:DNA-binding response OmpR family regulator
VGEHIVILSEQEERLVRALADRPGQLVPRDELQLAVWPDGAPADPRALDNRVKTLRARLRGLPLRIHTIRGQGLLLERT